MQPAPTDEAGLGSSQDPEAATERDAAPLEACGASEPAAAGQDPVVGQASSAFGSFVGNFCSRFSSGLGPMLNLPVQMQLLSLEQQSYEEFRAGPEAASSFVLAEEPSSPIQEPRAAGCVAVCPELAYVILDRLLGGSHEGAFIPTRPLTGLERALLRRVAALTAASLARAWPTYPPALGAVDDPPAALGEPTAIDQEPVWAISFSLKVGRHLGTMRLAIPLRWISWDHCPAAPGPGRGSYHPDGEGACQAQGSVELSAAVEGTTIPLEDLAGLASGDVVMTDCPADGEVMVRIAGIPKFLARLGASNGRRAITITRRIQ